MSNQYSMLRAQLIYLSQSTILLPNTAVAEVTRLTGEISPLPSVPVWIHGLIQWRGLTLPLMNVDSLLTGQPIALSDDQRVVVLNSMSANTETPFIAITAVGNPHLIKLMEDSLDDALTEEHGSHYILAQHTLNEKNVLVPDLNAIEESLSEAMEAANL